MKLHELNQQIDNLKLQRKTLLDNHYMDFAKFQVGDKIYAEVASNDYKMQFAGVVRRVYCKHDLDSATPAVYYEFTPDPSYHYGNNTESEWAYYYTHEDWVRHTQRTQY